MAQPDKRYVRHITFFLTNKEGTFTFLRIFNQIQAREVPLRTVNRNCVHTNSTTSLREVNSQLLVAQYASDRTSSDRRKKTHWCSI